MWDFCVCRNPGTKGFLVGFHTFLQQCWMALLPPVIVQTTLRSVVLLNISDTSSRRCHPPLSCSHEGQNISKCRESVMMKDISYNYGEKYHSSLFLNCICTWQWWMRFEIQGEKRMEATKLWSFRELNSTVIFFKPCPACLPVLPFSALWKFNITTISIFFFWLSNYPSFCCNIASKDEPKMAQKLFSPC